MDANELVEAYVTDIAVQLPRRQRNDVAFELRALLEEELQAKADAAGRPADAAMALELLRAFGRPAEVAARYRPAVTIIDPSDGSTFLRANTVGLAVIWMAGLVAVLQRDAGPGRGALSLLGLWWGGTVIPSLWWPGALVVGFSLAAWSRRRWPQGSTWSPPAGDRIVGGRAAMAMGLVGILCGLAMLAEPRWLLEVFLGSHAARSAYLALTYTESFLERQALLLLALVALNIPLIIAVLAKGRWSPLLRRIETALGLATCAVMLWAIADGPILVGLRGDRTAKFLMALIAAAVLGREAFKAFRRIRPSPDRSVEGSNRPAALR